MYLSAIKLARKDSSIELKCTQSKPISFGGIGTRFNLISVIKASVPSDPAIQLQKLKSCSPAVKGAESKSTSRAYPVFLRSTVFFGNSFLISTWLL